MLDLEEQLDFIYSWLAEMWEHPCNYGFENKDVVLEMHRKCGEWCEDCDNHTAKDCWKKYLEMKFAESEVANDQRTSDKLPPQ